VTPGLALLVLLLLLACAAGVYYTFRSLKPFDRQYVFEKVAKHLINQGRRALNEEDRCMYRARDGAMCALGCLIKDRYYSKSLEGGNILDDHIQKAVERSLGTKLGPGESGMYSSDLQFLAALQRIHDRKAPEEWRHHLRTFARAYDLRVPCWL